MEYVLHIAILAGVYVVLAVSLELLAGEAGLVSLCQAAFFGIGAYTSSLLMIHFGLSLIPASALAIAMAALLSLLVSLPSMRLRDDYFVISTVGFQLIVFSVLNNWTDVTRGSIGLTAIPTASAAGVFIQGRVGWACLSLTWAFCSLIFAILLKRSPFGRVLHAIREDEVFAQSLGKNTSACKAMVFAASAGLAGGAGALYASYMGAINPGSFTIMDSVMILSMVIIGGAGSLSGAVIGGLILIVLPEALRFTNLSTAAAANFRQIFLGGSMVLLMIFRPRGLVGNYGFRR